MNKFDITNHKKYFKFNKDIRTTHYINFITFNTSKYVNTVYNDYAL